MKMKLAALLAVIILGLAGCGGSNTSNGAANGGNTAAPANK